MPTIVHFNIPADNQERAKTFYEHLFDWKITPLPGPVPYHLVQTADAQGNPGVGGGIAQRNAPTEGITHFIGVDSVDEYMAKVEAAGGKVVEGKWAVPGFGYLAVCLDTEGNTFGLWEEDPQAHR